MLEWVREEVLKEYKNLAHNRRLQGGDRTVHQAGEGSDGEAVMDPAGAEGGKGLDGDIDEEEAAESAVCAFVANNRQKGTNQGSWKPVQQGWKKRGKKKPRRVGNPPLSLGSFIRAHAQGCFFCYERSSSFEHDHRTCPINKADTEAYKKSHETRKRTSANIREAKVEVCKDELPKRMMVGSKLAKEIQVIKRACKPKPDKDNNEDKDKKGKSRGGRKETQ